MRKFAKFAQYYVTLELYGTETFDIDNDSDGIDYILR